MNQFVTLEFPEGKVGFIGMVRAGDEGVNEFCVELPGRSPMYGEWDLKFAPNGNDCNVDIVSFGYGNKQNVGNTHPEAKNELTLAEKIAVEVLVKHLFAEKDVRNRVFPFTSKKLNFLGCANFRRDWIRGS